MAQNTSEDKTLSHLMAKRLSVFKRMAIFMAPLLSQCVLPVHNASAYQNFFML